MHYKVHIHSNQAVVHWEAWLLKAYWERTSVNLFVLLLASSKQCGTLVKCTTRTVSLRVHCVAWKDVTTVAFFAPCTNILTYLLTTGHIGALQWPMPSELWHCWLGVRKNLQKRVMRCWCSYFVCSKVQMTCIWSSWCHCHPIVSCFIKIQTGLTFFVPAYPGFHGKEAIKWQPVCLQWPKRVLQIQCLFHWLLTAINKTILLYAVIWHKWCRCRAQMCIKWQEHAKKFIVFQ